MVKVIKKIILSIEANEIENILREHFNAPQNAFVQFITGDCGDSLLCADISYQDISDEVTYSLIDTVVSNEAPHHDNERASPGTVKPRILRLIQAHPEGLSKSQIVSTTGIKPNSVRGTLWALSSEGQILKAARDLWCPIASRKNAAHD